MSETPYLNDALRRLRVIFRGKAGVELMEADVAALAGLDEEECRLLLAVLRETGAIEERRRRVFLCDPSSWWTSSAVRP